MSDGLKRKLRDQGLKIVAFILATIAILVVAVFKGFENLPKGVNEVIFTWAVLGALLLLRHRNELKDRTYLYISLIVIAFMIFWRVFFLNISSRYSSGLILPFVLFASFFLFNGLNKRRRRLVRLALAAAIVASTVVLFCMNFNGLTRNQHYDILAETFSCFDGTKGNHVFTVQKENFFRIGVIGGLDRSRMEAMGDEMTLDEYLAEYARVYPDTLVNIMSREPDAEPEKDGYKLTKIVSLCENKKKPKYRLIYSIESDSANRCVPISASRIGPYPANLLENGDFELVDSGEESAAKFNLHLPEGAMTASDEFRTPRDAFFSAKPPEKRKLDAMLEVRWDWVRNLINIPQQRLPECGLASDGDAIAGSTSVRINAPDVPARLMFDRQLTDGSYECNLLVRGNQGTEITVLYDVFRNGERETVPVATAKLTDKRLYRITARFTVDDLAERDFLQFGVEVVKGEACLDNVTLTAEDN